MRSKLITDEQISPYDKIGMSMAKKMKVKPPFKKKKEKGNQNAMSQAKFEHEIIPLDEFLNENYGDKETIFTHKNNPRYTFTVVKDGMSRIKSIDGLTPRIRFPFKVGETFNRSIETWACNHDFLIDGKDPCPEKKIFGVKTSDIPQGHEWRHLFPNKFR